MYSTTIFAGYESEVNWGGAGAGANDCHFLYYKNDADVSGVRSVRYVTGEAYNGNPHLLYCLLTWALSNVCLYSFSQYLLPL
jgi:hypothetical protein